MAVEHPSLWVRCADGLKIFEPCLAMMLAALNAWRGSAGDVAEG